MYHPPGGHFWPKGFSQRRQAAPPFIAPLRVVAGVVGQSFGKVSALLRAYLLRKIKKFDKNSNLGGAWSWGPFREIWMKIVTVGGIVIIKITFGLDGGRAVDSSVGGFFYFCEFDTARRWVLAWGGPGIGSDTGAPGAPISTQKCKGSLPNLGTKFSQN